MSNFTEETLTEAVLKRIESAPDPRFRKIMQSLVKHLHAFVREIRLTEREWFEGIRFLTETGQKCDEDRQEFILLSDTLGISMMVIAVNHPADGKATEATVFGPFYREGAPELENGNSIVMEDVGGEVTLVTGRVTDKNGRPLAGALLDVWQTAPNGLYESQDPEQPNFNFRGKFRTDRNGDYAFITRKPVSYSIPTDGPVGKMLGAMGRHSYRPAHIHFVVSAEGYEPVTTHVFVAGDKYLDSDAVFGVKTSLVADFKPCQDEALAKKYGLTPPFLLMTYDFGLMPAAKRAAAE